MKLGRNGRHIRDSPSVREVAVFLPLMRAVHRVTAFVIRCGVTNRSLNKIRHTLSDVLQQADLFYIPDRFNAAFSRKGWVATASLALDTMRKALELHEAGDDQAAEEEIMAWFQEDNIKRWAINRAKSFNKEGLVRVKRWRQLQEALSLTLEERYWAAVPLILVACDGFASDVLGFSPFKEDADLTVFDPTSLPFLVKQLTKGVRKTSHEEMVLPLRHGILHGRSLGYANRSVCMKAWHLMIALVDWAHDKSTEEQRIDEHESKTNVSIPDLVNDLQKLKADRQVMDEFEPRESLGSFNCEAMDRNSPEYAVIGFLTYWKKKNYGKMAERAVNLQKISIGALAGEMRNMAEFAELTDFEVRSVRQHAVAGAEAVVYLKGNTLRKGVEGEFLVLAFRYTGVGGVAMPDEKGRWHVQQNFIYDFCNRRTIDENDDTR